jgi:hypothetical protein
MIGPGDRGKSLTHLPTPGTARAAKLQVVVVMMRHNMIFGKCTQQRTLLNHDAPGVGEDSDESPGPEGPNSTESPPELPSKTRLSPSLSLTPGKPLAATRPRAGSDLSIRSDNTVTGQGDLPGIVSIF